jgi:putative membrane-bound dehydrogenase-like protein
MRVFLIILLCSVAPLFAQNGDRPGETQVAPFKDGEIPPAPLLTPEESLKTFKLQPGFKIELVASEPLIGAPVSMAFHPNGSLYVLEMRGYMPNVDGKGEQEIPGRVSILTDTDGDGKMDKSTVFLDGLIMPRAICLAYDGVLVAEPPNVWFCRDTNGDGVCDEKTLAFTGYGSQAAPEHTANGLMWGLDNWIYSANYTNRVRRAADGKWILEPSAVVAGRGQWGLSQDDFGRLVSNSNSDYLRGDLAPSELLFRNPHYPAPFGLNVQFDRNQETFPARMNPGVNRGYQKGQLRGDGTLASFTAACAPLIYRGDQFDPSYYGMAFVCEPAGNFVRASRITEKNGILTATNSFPKSEFLASTEERFRPVNLFNGPDGALYVVDMHHGLLQHRLYVTSYLRHQYLSRELDKPSAPLGRIYRVTQEGRPRRKIENFAKAGTAELVGRLNDANGWQRDTAQRLLVERADTAAVEPLKKIALSVNPEPAAVHALWTLDTLKQLDPQTISAAFASQNPRARAVATRLAGDRAFTELSLRDIPIKAASDPDPLVQLYAAFALGPISADKPAAAALAQIVERHAGEQLFRDAAISGLYNQEFAFLETLLQSPAFKENKSGNAAIIGALSRCAAISSQPGALDKVLNIAAAETPWRRNAMIEGILNVPPTRRRRNAPPVAPKPLRVASEPPALAALKKEKDLGEKIATLEQIIVWPGKPGYTEPVVTPLTKEEQERFEAGKATFLIVCAACHQPHGLGQEGLAPPLVDSPWVTGSEQRLVRIILQGLRGPINVNGKTVSLEMPPLAVLDDDQIASLMTYVRREWNHNASPVAPAFVAKVREETSGREEPWSEADLLKIK